MATKKLNVFKTIFIGDSNVGKTTIIQNYLNQQDNFLTNPTIGAAFFPIRKIVDGYPITLAIWDTAGQEKYQAMTQLYLRDCTFCIFVFDITDEISFLNLERWKIMVDNQNEHLDDPPTYFLVANKVDKYNDNGDENETEKIRERIRDFCENNNFEYYVGTSGITGDGISKLFDKILENVSGKIRVQNTVSHNLILSNSKCTC